MCGTESVFDSIKCAVQHIQYMLRSVYCLQLPLFLNDRLHYLYQRASVLCGSGKITLTNLFIVYIEPFICVLHLQCTYIAYKYQFGSQTGAYRMIDSDAMFELIECSNIVCQHFWKFDA